jgi:hypothetical protein
MAWQRKQRVEEIVSPFLRHSPGFEIVPELRPRESEAIFDRLSMSAFEGTPLEFALRDAQVSAFAVVGVATEVGIEPSVRHGADLGLRSGRSDGRLRSRKPFRGRALARRAALCGRRDPDRHRRVHRPPRPANDRRLLAERTTTPLGAPEHERRSRHPQARFPQTGPDRRVQPGRVGADRLAIGFWWAELTHPYWEFSERGYRVDVASPDGGKLEGDAFGVSATAASSRGMAGENALSTCVDPPPTVTLPEGFGQLNESAKI